MSVGGEHRFATKCRRLYCFYLSSSAFSIDIRAGNGKNNLTEHNELLAHMEHLEINQQAWNRRTEIHAESSFYNVTGFLNGDSTLNPLEIAQLGDVKGKSLLHLQCHFGLDSLSLARLGACVTGVDLSSAAIDKANELALTTNLNATFICSDVLQLRQIDSQQYDMVFSSYGVLCWLPELTSWAKVIADSLHSGGQFHLIEFHPFHDVMAGYPYFNTYLPCHESESTYTENSGDEEQNIVTWAHSISEVITALLDAGLVISQFNEHDYSPYDCFDGLQETSPGKFQLIQNNEPVPMLYSLVATKP